MSNETVYAFVKNKLEQINRSNHKRVILAKLRRGVGKEAGSVPEIWEFTLGDMPENLAGKLGVPSYAEIAVHLALTLYALHSQGNEGMHSLVTQSIGQAAAKLKQLKPNNQEGIKRRFDALTTAKTITEISYHAKGLIQLLKQEKIPLNYAQFASDLFTLQFDNSRLQVILRWGRDFYRYNKTEKEQND